MKTFILAAVLMMSFGTAFAQSDSQYSTTNAIMSPFEMASKILQSSSDMVSSKHEISASIQGRGVGGVEQLRDELVALNEDMANGLVRNIQDVRQPALFELFTEISESEEKMEQVNAVVNSGSRLQRIATAVTVELMLN